MTSHRSDSSSGSSSSSTDDDDHNDNDSSSSPRTLSILSPVGYSASTCGYCAPPSLGLRSRPHSSTSYGVWTHLLTPHHYQLLVDRGWRRSGAYVYRPDLLRTCCAQIPIRIEAQAYRPSKSQRRALADALAFVRSGGGRPARWKGKCSRERAWDVVARWAEVEWRREEEGEGGWAERVLGKRTRRLETTLRPSSSTEEKYQLFRTYQSSVHGESDSAISGKDGWERFLVETSLVPTWPVGGRRLTPAEEAAWRASPAVHLDAEDDQVPYGCYHQEWRLDGQLIAVGVLDILPRCVSSVYLFYDPAYQFLQLGKISAIREMALTSQLSRKRGMQALRHYYLGYYIPTCQKMRYKAEFKPCSLLDCDRNEWHSFVDVQTEVESGVRYGFTRSTASVHRPPSPSRGVPAPGSDRGRTLPTDPVPPGMVDPSRLFALLEGGGSDGRDKSESEAEKLLRFALVLPAKRQRDGVQPLLTSPYAPTHLDPIPSPELVQSIECLSALAHPDLVKTSILFL